MNTNITPGAQRAVNRIYRLAHWVSKERKAQVMNWAAEIIDDETDGAELLKAARLLLEGIKLDDCDRLTERAAFNLGKLKREAAIEIFHKAIAKADGLT